MQRMTDCSFKLLPFLCVLCQPQGCAKNGRQNSQGISTSSNLASFRIRAEREVFEIICCDKSTSVLFVHILLHRPCALFLGRGQVCPCALSWLLNAGPGAPWWEKGAKHRAGGAGKERWGEGTTLRTPAKSRRLQGADLHPRCEFLWDCYNPASSESCWYGWNLHPKGVLLGEREGRWAVGF